MKPVRTFFSLALSTVFAYFVSYFCLLFTRQGEMNVFAEFFYLYLHPTSAGLFLRIVFPLVWIAGFCYMTSVMNVNRDIKSEWMNKMLARPYSYPEERAEFYQKEAIPLAVLCLLFGAVIPAGKLYAPYFVMFPVRALLFFAANRLTLAFYRYAWCRDRLGGLAGTRD